MLTDVSTRDPHRSRPRAESIGVTFSAMPSEVSNARNVSLCVSSGRLAGYVCIHALRRSPVVMVKSPEYGNGLDATVHLRRARDGLLLGERLVRARPVVEAGEFGDQMSEVPLAENEDVVVVEKLAS